MLYYEVKGQGNPVVLLHGYLENLKMWKFISNELSEFYQVILIDLPGHGKSKAYGDIHTMDFMAEKVNEVLNELKIEKTVLIGHSMGGYATLAFAEFFHDKLNSFILLNSTPLPDSEEKKEQRLKAIETAKKNFDTLIKMSIPTLFAEKNRENLKEEMESAKQLAKETPLEGVTAALKGMRIRPDRSEILQDSEIPIGIIIGKYDQVINLTELKQIIPDKPNIQVRELETAHMSHLEESGLTLNFILDFLEVVYKK